jgi:hypothetical protein
MTVSKEMAVAIAMSQPELTKEMQNNMIEALMGENIKSLDSLTALIVGTLRNSSDLETAEENLLYAQKAIRSAANAINSLI